MVWSRVAVRSVTYGAVDRRQELQLHVPGWDDRALRRVRVSRSRSASTRSSGTHHPRIDIPGKVSGNYTYVQNVKIPGMWHARWVTPRGIGANTSQNHFPVSVDENSIKNTGAQVVRINNFVAVVAPKEYEAIQAASQLKVVWKSDPKFGSGSSGNYWSWMRKTGDTNTMNPARYTADMSATSPQRSLRRRRWCRRPTSTTTTTSCRSARMPRSRSRASGAKGATLYVQGQSVQGIPPNIATMLGVPEARQHPGRSRSKARARTVAACRGRRPSRQRSSRRRSASRCGCSGCAGTSTATTATAPRTCTTSRWASTRPARSSLPTGRATARRATTIDTTKELLGTATWAAVPGSGGPTPSDSACLSSSTGSPTLVRGGCWRRRSLCTRAR